MVIDTVDVYYERFIVGRISVEEDGKLSYAYDHRWIETANNFPLSVTMGMTTSDDHHEYYRDHDDHDHHHDVILPWLANLLPEEQQLANLTEILKLSPSDPLALLKEIGGDTAGAISINEPSEREKWEFVALKDYYASESEEDALIEHLTGLENRPFMAGEDGIRLSLAGGQKKTVLTVLDSSGKPKLGLPVEGDQLAIPMNGAPSTIIVKPQNELLPGIVENEAYCLALANLIGIDAVKTSVRRAGDKKALIVARYDRELNSKGGIKRLHQEDFAQANGIFPTQKYEKGTVPGLSFKQLLETGRMLPSLEHLKLLDQVIYNILVGNTDAHAKNYSIMLNSFTLAPLYDVSTVVLWKTQKINQLFAQKLAGKYRETVRLEGRHWDAIANESGYRKQNLKNQVRKLVKAMVAKRNEAIELIASQTDANADSVVEFAEAIEENALRIEGRLT